MVSSQEAMELLSDLRMGIELEILPPVEPSVLGELAMWLQPAHLQHRTGKELQPQERDMARAALIRKKLSPSGQEGD